MREAGPDYIAGQKIFVTGGRGFIGSHLIKRFLDRDNTVTIFDNGRRNALGYTDLEGHRGLTSIKGDVTDKSALAEAMGDADYVLHLAAIAGVSSYFKTPLRTLEVNIGGTQNLLSAILERQKMPKLIVGFSTSEIYGPHAEDVSEIDMTAQGRMDDRRWVYAISKLASEKFGYAYHWEHGLPTCWIRPFNVYGPGQVGEGAISAFAFRALRNETIRVTGDGEQTRAFCYIDDFCDAIDRCLAAPDKASGTSFNIGDPRKAISMSDLARKVIEISGSESNIEYVPHAGEDVQRRSPTIERAREVLGYSPSTDLEQGLRETIDWFKWADPPEPA